ncbi:uncharacterized protein LOC116033165 [Ipomoea triloba]|uniref:uncharacterized protein LOC116033165 n=1 Tax=Ipomoea triloba TaxID=35885 RepID=UPI00125D9170|nr:uncharacterized protein LOC116033165 [Ipomoea triloba]
MKSNVVYVLDPLPCNRDLEIKAPLSVAFRSTTNLKGQRAKNLLKWREIKCPTEPGSVECGYYVLRFMFEICTQYYEYEDLASAFAGSKSYTENQIHEIREI